MIYQLGVLSLESLAALSALSSQLLAKFFLAERSVA